MVPNVVPNVVPVYLTPPASPSPVSPPKVKRSRLERLERFKGNAKFRRHQLVCVKRSLKLQEQVDQDEREAEAEAEDSDIGEYDMTDPFVNDSKFEELPPMQLGLRPKEQITATRKRKRTDRYVPIEQVEPGDGEPSGEPTGEPTGEPSEYVSEYDESDESEYDPGSEYESEYDPNE